MQTPDRWAGSTLRQPTPSQHGLACWKALPDLIQNPLAIDTWGPLPPPGKLLGPCLHLRPSAPLHLFLAALCLGTLGQFFPPELLPCPLCAPGTSYPPEHSVPLHTHTNFVPRRKHPKPFVSGIYRCGREDEPWTNAVHIRVQDGRQDGARGDLNNLHMETRGGAKNGERENCKDPLLPVRNLQCETRECLPFPTVRGTRAVVTPQSDGKVT